MISLTALTKFVGQWADKQIGRRKPHQAILGVCEEAGELAHAQLKMEQKIRGTKDQHIEGMKDAMGDIVIFMADLCYQMDFDFEEIINHTWEKVQQRDWKKDPVSGGEPVCGNCNLPRCPACGG